MNSITRYIPGYPLPVSSSLLLPHFLPIIFFQLSRRQATLTIVATVLQEPVIKAIKQRAQCHNERSRHQSSHLTGAGRRPEA